MTEEYVIGCIFTDMRLLKELPNHIQAAETKGILADYREKVPDLHSEAERRHAAFKQAA